MNATIATLLGSALLAPALFAAAPAAADPGDPGACTAATPNRVMVSVRGLKNSTGKVRVQIYDAAGFLKKGRWLGRVEVPAQRSGVTVCVAVPRAGQYGIAVRHDANGNGKSDWNDGGGFSRDPRLSLTKLQPDFAKVAVPLDGGVNRIAVTMNYRRGLSIGPIG
ncbi:DUF2141 domain-containing protein [Sphingomonas desiccabilis]|uniref:DUF2141 domain-containing protein n=1 Tax=Sphingomonas desiccabilis TaxID=429134 RepID=A0A4Q2IZD9_9SPHN|nr:DUF2141 domain-containing protein [Sphingomonas desiccabilis]MBB3910180.1 uncharacterized protein (DUF2141 family) [Sphingomonas desiccabilis]RXZ34858.1 DUF2141 domain-containing protein [Sphingomonas desiccabilis]